MGKLHAALKKAEGGRRAAPSGTPAPAPAAERGPAAAAVGQRVRSDADPHLVVLGDPESEQAESFRAFRGNLAALAADRPLKAVAITSATAGEGRSVTAANLACALAEDGKSRVVLIDADLRRPALHRFFGVDNQRGLADYLGGGALLEMALQRSRLPNLFVLPAGQAPGNPGDAFGSPRLEDLLARLRRDYDWVVVDAPPASDGAELAAVAKRTDGTVVVARLEATPRETVLEAVETVRRSGATVLGTVLTAVPSGA